MSWQLTGLVKSHFVGPPALKLLAMVLADYADLEGGEIRPSVPTLAGVMGVSVRTVSRLMGQLRDMGFIEPVGAGKGGARMRNGEWVGIPTSYRIGNSWIDNHPDKLSGCAATTLTPRANHPDTAVAGEYSIEESRYPPTPASPAGESARAIKLTLKAARELWAERGERAFGEGDRVFRMRVPAELLELQWTHFQQVHADGRERRTLDGWRTAFRRTVRANVYGLWVCRADGSASPAKRALELLNPTKEEVAHAA